MFVVVSDFRGSSHRWNAGDLLDGAQAAVAFKLGARIMRVNAGGEEAIASSNGQADLLALLMASSPASKGVPSSLYVAASASPGGNGSQSKPFQTLDQALALAVPTFNRVEIYVEAGDYESELLFQLPLDNITIIGLGSRYVSDVFTLASYSSTDITLTFAGSPGWTADEWMGYDLEFVDGPSAASNVGIKKTISHNTTGAINLAYRYLATVVAGDEFRVCEPGVRITVPQNIITLFSQQRQTLSPVLRCARSGSEFGFSYPRDWTHLKNITLHIKEDMQNDGRSRLLEFTGCLRANGLHVLSDIGAVGGINFTSGAVMAGGFINIPDWNPPMGWGISLRHSSNDALRPRAFLRRTNFEANALVAESLYLTQANASLRAMALSRQRSANSPHGVIGLTGGSFISMHNLAAGTIPAIYLNSQDNAEPSLWLDANSRCEFYHTRCHHMGANLWSLLRSNSTLKHENPPIVDGSNAGITLVGATCAVTLEGASDYSVLGAVTCGNLVRPAGAWANGESILDQANVGGTIADYRDSIEGAGYVVKTA